MDTSQILLLNVWIVEMTNKITEINVVVYLGTIKPTHFNHRVLSSSELFGYQGEIEILSIYTSFANIKYSQVNK